MARGHRFSALPIAQFCAKAPTLSNGAGRSAAQSSAFHARCAGDPKWRDMWARLTDEEQRELSDWLMPAPVRVGGLELRYEDANKEIPLGLTEHGAFTPKGAPNAMTEGTADLYWVHGSTVYLADLKRSEYTTADGPRSLQIIGYALAACALHEHDGVDSYATGVWSLTDGTWEWSDLVMLDSEQAARDWERVRAAALHLEGDFSMGPHCRGCWQRTKCPAYMLPAGDVEGVLAPLVTGELDQPKALQLLTLAKRAETLAEAAIDKLKAYALQTGGIHDPESGQVWKAIATKGRMGFDAKALERDEPETYQRYVKQGKPGSQFRWVNDEKKGA